MLGLFRRRRGDVVIENLYQRIAAGSRQVPLYLRFAVPDTAEGRFESLTLHAVLVLRRLKQLPAPAEDVAQDLVDLLFRELDRALRELGVGDLSVGKRIKKLAKAFYGRAAAYEAALDTGDESTVAAALGRNALDRDMPAEIAFARYVMACDTRLATLSLEAILTGSPLFEPLAQENAA